MPSWVTAPADPGEDERPELPATLGIPGSALYSISDAGNKTGNTGATGSVGYMVDIDVSKGGSRPGGNLNRQTSAGNEAQTIPANPPARQQLLQQLAPMSTANTSKGVVGLGLKMSSQIVPTATPAMPPRPSSSGGPSASGLNGMSAQDGRASAPGGTSRPHPLALATQAMVHDHHDAGMMTTSVGNQSKPYMPPRPRSSTSTTPQNQYDARRHGDAASETVYSPAHIRNIMAALNTGQPLTTTSVAAANAGTFVPNRTSFSNPTPPQTANLIVIAQNLYHSGQNNPRRQLSISPDGDIIDNGQKSSLDGGLVAYALPVPLPGTVLPNGQNGGQGQMIHAQQQRTVSAGSAAGSVAMQPRRSIPGHSGVPQTQAVMASPLQALTDLPQQRPPNQYNAQHQQLGIQHMQQRQQQQQQQQHQAQRQQAMNNALQQHQQNFHPALAPQQLVLHQSHHAGGAHVQPPMQNGGLVDQPTQHNGVMVAQPRRPASGVAGAPEMAAPPVPPPGGLMGAIDVASNINAHNMQVTWDKMQETFTSIARAASDKANEDAALVRKYRDQRNAVTEAFDNYRKESAGAQDQLKEARELIKGMGVELESRATSLTRSANLVVQQNAQIEADVTMKRNHTSQIEALKAMNDRLKADAEAAKKSIKEYQSSEKAREDTDTGKLDKLQKGIEAERAKMLEWQKEQERKLAEAEQKAKKAEEDLETAREDLIQAQSKLEVYSTTASKSDSASEDVARQLKALEAKCQSSAKEVIRLNGELESSQNNFDRLKKQSDSVRAEARLTEEELDKEKADRAQLESEKKEAIKAKKAADEVSEKQRKAVNYITASIRKRFGITESTTSTTSDPAAMLSEVMNQVKTEMDKLRDEVLALTKSNTELKQAASAKSANLESARIGKVEKEKAKLVEDLEAAKLADEVRRTYALKLEGEIKEMKEKIEQLDRAKSASVASSFEEGEIVPARWSREKKDLMEQIKDLKENQTRLKEKLTELEERSNKEEEGGRSKRPTSPQITADTRAKSRTADSIARDEQAAATSLRGAKGPPTPDSDGYSNGAAAAVRGASASIQSAPKASKCSTPIPNPRAKSTSAPSRMRQAAEKMSKNSISDGSVDAMRWGMGRASSDKKSGSVGTTKAKKPRQTDPGPGMKGGISVNDPISIDDDDDDNPLPAPMSKSASGQMLPPDRSKSASIPPKTSKKRSRSPLFSMAGDDEDEDDGNDTPSSVTKPKKRKTAKRRIESESPSPPPRSRDDHDDNDSPGPSKPRDLTKSTNPNPPSTSTSRTSSSNALLSTAPAGQPGNYRPRKAADTTSSEGLLATTTSSTYNIHNSPAPSTMSLGSIPSTRNGQASGRPVSREWALLRIHNLITTYMDGKRKVCKMCITEMPKEERKRIPANEREPLRDSSEKGQLDHVMAYHADTLRRFKTKRQNAGDEPQSPI